jgi:hypothetical protein
MQRVQEGMRDAVGRLYNHPVSSFCDTSQRAGILIGNVVKLRGPVVEWRSIREAVFRLERGVRFYPVHKVEIAHLIVIGKPAES